MYMTPKTMLALPALGFAALSMLSAGQANAAVTLVELDFAGTGGTSIGVIPSSDAQFTVINSAVTFDSAAEAITVIGGAAGTSSWVYDATATAAANPDLHTASTFGAPTRFDLDLGVAASGFSYSITRVEIDVRASNSVGTSWDFMYRKQSDSSTIIQNGGAIATQGGADPITTYSIDLSTALNATDSTTDWNVGGTGELRFAFFEATAAGNDNLQIDAIRVIGDVVPEPSSLALLGLGGLAMIRRRR